MIEITTVIALYVNIGPPAISIDSDNSTFSLLPPSINRITINRTTRVSVNIPGKWVTPNGMHINNNTLSYYELSQSGLYRFYINDWYGTEILAIQIQIYQIPGL